MGKKVASDHYPDVSSFCFGLIAVFRVIGDLFFFLKNGILGIFNVNFILSYIVTLGLPVLIYRRKKDQSLALVAFISLALNIVSLLSGFCIMNVLFLIKSIAIFLLVLFTCYPPMKSKRKLAEKYWNIPALITGILIVMNIGEMAFHEGLWTLVKGTVTGFLEITAVLFMSLWLTGSRKSYSLS